MEVSERIIFTNNWTTLLLVLSFLLLVVIKESYPRRFLDLLSLPVSSKFFSVHGKEDKLQHTFNILFFLFQILNVSILIHLILVQVFGHTPGDSAALVQIATLYCVFVLSKVLIEKIIGNIFSIEPVMDTYLYEKLAYRNYLSMAIFAGNLIFLYALPPNGLVIKIFVLLLVLVNVFTLLTLFRRNWNSINLHFLYFILYLCALEISPYIILYYLFFK